MTSNKNLFVSVSSVEEFAECIGNGFKDEFDDINDPNFIKQYCKDFSVEMPAELLEFLDEDKETEYVDPNTKEIFDVDRRTGEVINRFPLPYPYFRDELEMRCSGDPSRILHLKPLPNYSTDEEVLPMFVSRMPNHKVKGSAHMETIRAHFVEDGKDYSVSKVNLSTLKLKNGEIENYFNSSSDVLLYNALKDRLLQFGGDGKKAFAEPFYKPKSDGTRGPLVKRLK